MTDCNCSSLSRSEVEEIVDEKLDRAVEEIFLYIEEEHQVEKRQLKKSLRNDIL